MREHAVIQANLVWGFKGNQWQLREFIRTGSVPEQKCDLPPETDRRVKLVQRWMDINKRIPTEAETEQIINGA